MKKIEDLSEIHSLELGILDAFNEFCLENGIKYSLYAGTMIGAVRHQGFIPWDDDIDIFMLREEYDRFLEKTGKGFLLQGRYKVCPPETLVHPFTKIVDSKTIVKNYWKDAPISMGIWIDIFPVDNAYDSLEENKEFLKKQRKRLKYREYFAYPYARDLPRTVAKKIYLAALTLLGMGSEYWIKKCRDIPVLPKSSYAGTLQFTTTENDIYPAEYFNGYTELPFEGKKYMVFARYHDLLTWRYGDYMKLPPVEQRYTHSLVACYI